MSTAFKATDILLPKSGTDLSKWAVVACDQYTSQPEYWEKTAEIVGGSPSTLKLILPEVYLEDEDVAEKIEKIHACMKEYLDGDTFDEYKNSYIYIERVQSDGKVRQGLIGAIDLEQYDYRKGSTSPVRATEATVIERIPPRVKVRIGADIELPHIMILINDEDKSVIEPLGEVKDGMKLLYKTELIQGGGAVSGYLAEDNGMIEKALDKLADKCPDLLFAMGDGNHSLATAKDFYERLKKENPDKDLSDHPARYALVELVNLHSSALEFEAIHRIADDVDVDDLISAMTKELDLSDEESRQSFSYLSGGEEHRVYIHDEKSNLTVGSLQSFLDGYIKTKGGKIDYIHGIDTVRELASKANSIGFVLPDMDKAELFPTVIKDGALPRKTFSMGHAEDKRFYMECRRITV